MSVRTAGRWTRVSPRAHVAKFYVRLQLIRRARFESIKFSVLKFIAIVILWIYYMTSLLASASFGTFVWLRTADEGSVPKMRIWSILLSLSSYCKSQALTLNTVWGFCKIYTQSTFFVLAERGGGSTQIYLQVCTFHFVIKFRLLLSICGLHFWCPLNLKMLPTPLRWTTSFQYSQDFPSSCIYAWFSKQELSLVDFFSRH